jgi:hypothetical protein
MADTCGRGFVREMTKILLRLNFIHLCLQNRPSSLRHMYAQGGLASVFCHATLPMRRVGLSAYALRATADKPAGPPPYPPLSGGRIKNQYASRPHHHASDGPPPPRQKTSHPGRPQEISRSDGKLVMIWQPSLVTTTSSSMRAAPEPSSAPFQVSSANTMPSFSGVFWPV